MALAAVSEEPCVQHLSYRTVTEAVQWPSETYVTVGTGGHTLPLGDHQRACVPFLFLLGVAPVAAPEDMLCFHFDG